MLLISTLANRAEIDSLELDISLERLFEEPSPIFVVAVALSVSRISKLSDLDGFDLSELKDLVFFTAAACTWLISLFVFKLSVYLPFVVLLLKSSSLLQADSSASVSTTFDIVRRSLLLIYLL